MKFTVIGLGKFGYSLAIELSELGHEVIALDREEKVIEDIKDSVTFAATVDATDTKALSQLGVMETDAVIIAIGNDFSCSLLITGNLQAMGVKRLLCRELNPVHARILKLMNVNETIQAEEIAARQLAKRMGIRKASKHFGLDKDYAIVELELPKALIGETLITADVRNKFAINIITVKRKDGSITGIPDPKLIFKAGDHLVIFGAEKDIKRFSKT